jgi:N-acetylglutamate synthase-like GNAT family acetyltransferase
MNIRKFKPEDAETVSNIIKECHLKQNLGSYSKEVNEGQIKDNSSENLLKFSETVRYYVAVENNKIIGIGGYGENKVRTFFVKPDFQGKSVGGAILKKVLSEAKKEGIKKLGCRSTVFARPFYGTFGFKEVRELSLSYCNSTIKFIEMEKSLV